MTVTSKVGINPLPWVLRREGFDFSVANLLVAFPAIAAAGFDAVQADIPTELSVGEYRDMLRDHGLRPAPGYFAANFDGRDGFGGTLERARRHGAAQAELGLTETFFASEVNPTRMATPAVGAGYDAAILESVVALMAEAAAAITSEGVTPCLHPHVGSWVETELEIRAVLDGVDSAWLSFGPDIGHLFWAGVAPAGMIATYADRVRGVHIKDVHRGAVERAQRDGKNYLDAVYEEHVFTEPGCGDVDFDHVLSLLPLEFDGWFVVEVDNPDGKSNEESTVESARWVQGRRAAGSGRAL
jgi:inosose dehydratase